MPTSCWLTHLCSIRALVPVSFFLFLSRSFSGYFIGAQRPSEFTFLPELLRSSREGTLCFHPIERVPEASMNRASPMPGALLAFYVNQGTSASFSPLLSYRRLWTTRFQSIKGPQQRLQAGKQYGLIWVWIAHSGEKAMAPHSSTLAWKTPWTRGPRGLQSLGTQRVRHDLVTEQQQQLILFTVFKTKISVS